ncbi:hypothetical protein G6F31_019858 [Rhizopus arrhizus]|nr:hypothetical protein G6F31_019858 [Rhizopus arrhizus]
MWMCRSKPPMVLPAVTRGGVRSCGRITQSCRVRRSVAVYGVPSGLRALGSASTVYMKISPNPVELGPISGSNPSGSWEAICCRRSATCWRAKYRSVPSLKTTVTCESP